MSEEKVEYAIDELSIEEGAKIAKGIPALYDALDKFNANMWATIMGGCYKGKTGWDDPDVVSDKELLNMLDRHVFLGNWADVAVISMFLEYRGVGDVEDVAGVTDE